MPYHPGAALAFPFFSTPYSPLSLSGKLYLPPSFRYSVAVGGARTDADAVSVIVPAQGGWVRTWRGRRAGIRDIVP